MFKNKELQSKIEGLNDTAFEHQFELMKKDIKITATEMTLELYTQKNCFCDKKFGKEYYKDGDDNL